MLIQKSNQSALASKTAKNLLLLSTLLLSTACTLPEVTRGEVKGGIEAELKGNKPTVTLEIGFEFDFGASKDDHKARIAMFKTLNAHRGLTEVPGAEHDPLIQKMHESVGLLGEPDETPWCSSAINWAALAAGVNGTNKASARSWLNWRNGRSITLAEALPGDVVVFWRESPTSWKGHVALFVSQGKTPGTILVIGGNQGDRLSVVPYPIERILGVRRVTKG